MDGFFFTGKAGFQVMILHVIDESSMFHMARRLENRHLNHVLPALGDMWFAWAGVPDTIYTDPAGEFVSQEWLSFCQENGIEPRMSTEAWQKGRVERHGQTLKNMLHRFDQENTIITPQMLDEVLRACCQAKNALARHGGYAPEQIVLGKSTKVPASLVSDDSTVSHSLALDDSPESDRDSNSSLLHGNPFSLRIMMRQCAEHFSVRRAL